MKFTRVELEFKDVVACLADVNYSSSTYTFYRTNGDAPEPSKEEVEKLAGEPLTLNLVCFEDVLAYDLFAGGSIQVLDENDDEEEPVVHTITLQSFKDGLVKLQQESEEAFSHLTTGDYDVNDQLSWLQCTLYGEIVYDM